MLARGRSSIGTCDLESPLGHGRLCIVYVIKQLYASSRSQLDWNLRPREPSRPRTLMYRKTQVTNKTAICK